MLNKYIVRVDTSERQKCIVDDFIEHAQSAYNRRLNYDSAKRRERYLKDRDAGKTGYKGVKARTSNPYGNYASLYYNPEKAAEYYRTHRKQKIQGSKKTKAATKTINSQAVDNSDAAGGTGGSGGSGGSSGSGGSQAANQAVRDKIQKLKENSQFETAAQRKATQMKIDQLRKALEKKLKAKEEERAKIVEEGEKERDSLQKKASSDIENAQKTKTENIEKDKKEAKEKKEAAVKPFREDNAKLRAQIDSMGKGSDPKQRAKLIRQLARNNDKINKANADYTDSLFKSKTKHTNDMRNGINEIRTKLYNAKTASSTQQRSKVNNIRSEIYNLKSKNQQEIQNAKAKLNEWISNEKTRVGKETARLSGTEWKDPSKENAKYEKRVKARAKEILRRSK